MSILLPGLVVLTLIAGSITAKASQPAFDSAADSAYNSGWADGSNGGFGWGGPWAFTFLSHGAAFTGSSATNGNGDPNGDGDINTPRSGSGRAWGLSSDPGFDVIATRPFGGPLLLGQTFSIDFDDFGSASPNYGSSLFLLAPDGSTAIRLDANVGLDYRINPTVTEDSGVPETDQGIHLAFTQLTSEVQVSITPYLAGASTTTLIIPYAGQIDAVQFQANTMGTNPFVIPYINDIAITPEPSGAALFGLVCGCSLLRRRRQ